MYATVFVVVVFELGIGFFLVQILIEIYGCIYSAYISHYVHTSCVASFCCSFLSLPPPLSLLSLTMCVCV